MSTSKINIRIESVFLLMFLFSVGLMPLVVNADIRSGDLVHRYSCDSGSVSGVNVSDLVGSRDAVLGQNDGLEAGVIGEACTITANNVLEVWELPTSDITLSFWLNGVTSTGNGGRFYQMDSAGDFAYWDGSEAYTTYYIDSGYGSYGSYSGGLYHMVVVLNSTGNFRGYQDGELIVDTTSTGLASSGTLMNRLPGLDRSIVGYIDEVNVWDVGLSEQEVISLYANESLGYGYDDLWEAPAPSEKAFVSVSVLNSSNDVSSRVSQGENFVVNASFIHGNGSVLSDAYCNFTIEKGIVEYDSQTQNFSVWSDSSFIETFHPSSYPETVEDTVHFYGCHSGPASGPLIVNLSCSGGETIFVLNSSDLVSCPSGSSQFFLESDSCISEESVTVRMSLNEPLSKKVIVSGLALDRQDDPHFMETTSGEIFYNASSESFQSNHSHEYYRPGDYNISVACNDGDIYNSSVFTLSVLYSNIPFIRIEGGNNSLNSFNLPGNVSFGSGLWYFFAVVEDFDLSWVYQEIRNTSGLVSSSNESGNFFLTVNSSAFNDFAANNFTYTVKAGNGFGNVSSLSYNFLVFDEILPMCLVSDASVMNDSTYNFSIPCVDENFFSFNVSCSNGFSYYVDGLNVKSYLFENSTLILGDTVCDYRYCDGHTARSLKKDSFSKKSGDSVTFFTKVKKKPYNVTFSALSEYPEKIETFKDDDRIRFTFYFSKSQGKKARSFIYHASESSIYLESEEYKGWIVDPVSLTWFDSNIGNDPDALVTVERVSFTDWKITVQSDKDVLEFESIGELNCLTDSQTIEAVVVGPGKTSFDDLSEALLYWGFTFLWLIFVVLLFVVPGRHGGPIQLFNILQFIISVMCFFLWINFSGIFFLMSILTLGGGATVFLSFLRRN